jgi:hypothetical protein
MLHFHLFNIGDVNPYDGIVGVRGTSTSIKVWNTWPQHPNHLPLYAAPAPFTEKQLQANRALQNYLEESCTSDALQNFQLFLDMQVQSSPIADFWTLGDTWQQFASLVAPTMPVQYRAVYNVRTSEAEQDSNLKYVAYVSDNRTSYHLGIVKRQHVEQV